MLFLAIRHLLSRKRQTLLILFGISLGTMIYVGIAGIQLGFRSFIVAKLINNNAHISISGREEDVTPQSLAWMFAPKSLVHWIVPPSGKRDEARVLYPQGWFVRLDAHPSVIAYAPQFTAQALFRQGSIRVAGQIVGINVEKQLKVTDLKSDIIEGNIESISTGGKRIVLGSGLAKKLGARYGQTVLVSSANQEPQPFKIVGIYHSGVQQIDDAISYGSISDIQQLAGTPSRITSIGVKLADVEEAKTLAEQWSLTGQDKVQSWDQANASILQVFQIQDIVRNFITWTVLIVAAFGIYNVLTIIINQKKREIAILRAIGFSPRQIERLFLLQGAILGIAGAFTGLVLGYFLCRAVEQIKLEGAGFERLMVSYDPTIYLYGLLSAVVAAIVAGYLPARTARHMTPVEIIRAEA